MKPPPSQAKIDRLALAVAQGRSVRAAARSIGLSETTARRWASEPDFPRRVDAIREQIISKAVGRLAWLSVKAADRLGKLIADGVEPGLQLMAARAILADLLMVREQTSVAARLAEMEGVLEQFGKTDQA
jgi:hypothetical protein